MEKLEKAVTLRKQNNGLVSVVVVTLEDGIAVSEIVGRPLMAFEAVADADSQLRAIAKEVVGA